MIPTSLGCLVWPIGSKQLLVTWDSRSTKHPGDDRVKGIPITSSLQKESGERRTPIPRLLTFPFELSILSWNWYTKKIDTPYSSGSNLTVSQCFDQPPTFSWEKSHRFFHFFLVNLWPSGHAHVAGASAGSAPPLASAANARTAASPGAQWVAFCRQIDI